MLSVRPIGEEHNEEMLKILLDSPMESDGLSLCLDRSPDMLAVPRLFFDSFKCFGFYMDDTLKGYAMICLKRVYVNGKPRKIGYLANMYVLPEARKLGWLYKASEPLFREALVEAGLGYAVTLVGNRKTEPMIGRRISKFPFIPHSASIGVYLIHNILITFGRRPVRGFSIRRAGWEDLPAIARLLDAECRSRLFGPINTETHLRARIESRPGFGIGDFFVAERDGNIVGACSAWDVSSFRKVRVLAYRGTFRVVHTVYGMVGPLLGFPKLPAVGQPFRELVINDYGVENRDPVILRALITHIYQVARKQGYNMIQVGSYEGDPILEATRGFFTQPLHNHVIFGSGDPDLIEKENIDIARPWVELALT